MTTEQEESLGLLVCVTSKIRSPLMTFQVFSGTETKEIP